MKCVKTLLSFLVITMGLYAGPALSQNTDSLTTQLAEKWVHSKDYTLKMAELMPEELYDFHPVEEEMSFKEQLLHLAQNIDWLSNAYLIPGGKQAPRVDAASMSKAEVIEIVKKAYDTGLKAHQLLAAKDLDTKVKFFAGPKSKRQILILLHDHQTHHAGQLIVYLRLNKIKPPAYVGW